MRRGEGDVGIECTSNNKSQLNYLGRGYYNSELARSLQPDFDHHHLSDMFVAWLLQTEEGKAAEVETG